MANRLYNKQVSPKGYKVGGPVKDNKGLKTADSINKPTNYDLASKLPLQKPPMMYKRAYLSSIEDDSKKTVAERKANSISRLEAIGSTLEVISVVNLHISADVIPKLLVAPDARLTASPLLPMVIVLLFSLIMLLPDVSCIVSTFKIAVIIYLLTYRSTQL
jgi:hypothetical protein